MTVLALRNHEKLLQQMHLPIASNKELKLSELAMNVAHRQCQHSPSNDRSTSRASNVASDSLAPRSPSPSRMHQSPETTLDQNGSKPWHASVSIGVKDWPSPVPQSPTLPLDVPQRSKIQEEEQASPAGPSDAPFRSQDNLMAEDMDENGRWRFKDPLVQGTPPHYHSLHCRTDRLRDENGEIVDHWTYEGTEDDNH